MSISVAVVVFLIVSLILAWLVGNQGQFDSANAQGGDDPSSDAKEVQERPRERLSNVRGMPAVQKEVRSLIDALRKSDRYVRLGARLPRGVLLHGPPGTGKTLLAKALAGETNYTFLHTTATQFRSMWYGQSSANVRKLFERARAQAPAIIFVDEIDALGSRDTVGLGESSQTSNTINQFLTCMDGFATTKDPREHVLVVAATNRRRSIDPALLRGGRFEVQIEVLPPDRVGRAEIFQEHLQQLRSVGIPDAPESYDPFAAMTEGCTGADIESFVQRAARFAVDADAETVGATHVHRALEFYRCRRAEAARHAAAAKRQTGPRALQAF